MGRSPTSWKPGQSGNPLGKPRREKTIASVLRAKLDTDAFAEKLKNETEKRIEILGWQRGEGSSS